MSDPDGAALCVELIRTLASTDNDVFMQISWMTYDKIAMANHRLERAAPMWDTEYAAHENQRLALFIQQLNALHDMLLESLSKDVHAGSVMYPLASLVLGVDAQRCGSFLLNADESVAIMRDQITALDAYIEGHLVSAARALRVEDLPTYEALLDEVERTERKSLELARFSDAVLKGYQGHLGVYEIAAGAFRTYSTIPDELLASCGHLVLPLVIAFPPPARTSHLVSVVVLTKPRTIEVFDSNGVLQGAVSDSMLTINLVVREWASLSGMFARGYTLLNDAPPTCVALQRDLGGSCAAWTSLMATLRLLCPAQWDGLRVDDVVRRVLSIATGIRAEDITTEGTFDVRARLIENWIAFVWQVYALRRSFPQFYVHGGRDAPEELPRRWGTRRVLVGGRLPLWVRASDPIPPPEPMSPLEHAAVDYLECRGWRYYV